MVRRQLFCYGTLSLIVVGLIAVPMSNRVSAGFSVGAYGSAAIDAQPDPFYYGATEYVTGWIDGSAGSLNPWYFCFDYDGCYVGGATSSVELWADGPGFYGYSDSEYEAATVYGTDQWPGTYMRPMNYYTQGWVTYDIWYCYEDGCWPDSWGIYDYAQTSVWPDYSSCIPTPSGEQSTALGWNGAIPTAQDYQQALIPQTPGFWYSGRFTLERTIPPNSGYDSCWFPGSSHDPQVNVSNSIWPVLDDNTYGPDGVGWLPDGIAYYRAVGRAISGCYFSFPQTMYINACGAYPDVTLWSTYQNNLLESGFDNYYVWSSRQGIYRVRSW
jgi:hypothetical protein